MTLEIRTQNPATEEFLQTYQLASPSMIQEALLLANTTYHSWRKTTFSERTALLLRIEKNLLSQKNSLAILMHQEMGKNLKEAEAEIEKCAACAKYYAEQGPDFLQPNEIKTEALKSYVSFEPLGTVLAIMPWNCPFWQALRCALPAIMAGNSVILKHASNVSGCAIAIEKIFTECFGKKGIFQTLIIPGDNALALIQAKEISAVSFTGSTVVGKKIASAAGLALKKTVLELGGSDAYIVLADADIQKTAELCAYSRLINVGQSCIAAKRFIVEESVKKEFEFYFTQAMQKDVIAPMARHDLRLELHDQVMKSQQEGAQLICGGNLPDTKGFFYPPTVLTDVKPECTAFREELFGPVAAIISAKNREEAIKLANLSPYGLGAAIFTATNDIGEQIAKSELEAGSCFVNTFVRSDPRLPFGGIKESGYGRELSFFGLREFTNIKTVYLASKI